MPLRVDTLKLRLDHRYRTSGSGTLENFAEGMPLLIAQINRFDRVEPVLTIALEPVEKTAPKGRLSNAIATRILLRDLENIRRTDVFYDLKNLIGAIGMP